MIVAAIVGVVVHIVVMSVIPAMAVHIIVVGIVVSGGAGIAGEGMIGGHGPGEGGTAVAGAEAQVGSCAIDFVVGHEVDTFQVDGHVDFIAGVGIPTIEPNFVKRRTDLLGPHFVDEAIGGHLILVAAPNHQFVLVVEHRHGAGSLMIGEIKDVFSCGGECGYNQGQG